MKNIPFTYLIFAIIALVAIAFIPTFWLGAGTMTVFSTVCFTLSAILSAFLLFVILRSVVLEITAKRPKK